MKIIKSIVFFYLLLVTNSLVNGQEVIYPLNVNQTLINQQGKNSNNQRRSAIADTLGLPFEDDFSRPGIYPFDGLWLDSGVYIKKSKKDRCITRRNN